MDLALLLSIGVPVLAAIIAYVIRESVMNRISKLEEAYRHTISEERARQIMTDKMDPIKEDLKEIRDQVNKLFDKIVHG